MEAHFNTNNTIFYNHQTACRGAVNILQGSHWNADASEEQEKENSGSLYKGMTISEGQGSLSLRRQVCKVIQEPESFFSLSLESLRDAREENPGLFTTLQCKRIGHSLNLKGVVTISGMGAVDLESFNETFTIPMIGASLLKWASTKTPEVQQKAQAILSIFENALFHDNVDETKIEKALKELAEGRPVLVGSGWNWHSTEVILIPSEEEDYNYLISANRGDENDSGGSVSGWNIYKTLKIDSFFIKHLASRINHTQSEYLSCQKLVDELGAKLIYQYPMKVQRVGNCTYSNVKGAVSALMKIFEKTHGFKLKASDELFLTIEKGEKDPTYKSFSCADKHYVLEDFLIDLKENKEANHVKTLAQLIYGKLMDSPSMGFKIGWKLWLKTIDLCHEAFPHLDKVDPDIKSLILQFIAEEDSSNKPHTLNHLLNLIFILIDKNKNQYGEVADSVNYFKSFLDKGKNFQEAEEVSLKLLQANELSLAMDLMIFLIQKGEVCEKAFTLWKFTLLQNFNEGFFGQSKFQDFLEKLINMGKVEIVKLWMEDREVEEPLRVVLDNLFIDLSYLDDRCNIAKQLVPLLSKDVLTSHAMETLCNKLIEVGSFEEAKELGSHLEGKRKENVMRQIPN